MSLFQCEECGCVENTATASQGFVVLADCFDWTGMEDKRGMRLCSACGPTHYSDGKPTEYGKWHGVFKRTFLPKGMFRTARNGNLEHIETGEQDYHKYAVPNFEVRGDGRPYRPESSAEGATSTVELERNSGERE